MWAAPALAASRQAAPARLPATAADPALGRFNPLPRILFHDDFDAEFSSLDEDLQDELLAHARLLAQFGPHLGRPTVDTLKGSKHANMKELRFS